MAELDLGERLRAFRLRRTIKQEAMAFDLGVSQATISRLESGASLANRELAERIETLLARPENLSAFDYWRAAIARLSSPVLLYRTDRRRPELVELSSGARTWLDRNAAVKAELLSAIADQVGAGMDDLAAGPGETGHREWRFEDLAGTLAIFPVSDDRGGAHVLVELDVTP